MAVQEIHVTKLHWTKDGSRIVMLDLEGKTVRRRLPVKLQLHIADDCKFSASSLTSEEVDHVEG